VELAEVQRAAFREERVDDPGPAIQVRQPVECAEARVDDVEALPAERLDGVVDVGGDEAGIEIRLLRKRVRRVDRGLREVEADYRGAAPRPREAVEPEVALQVDEPLARDVADLLDLERPQRRAARAEPLDVVEVARDVDRNALVPPRAVV
jgi:hypothetical protein